MSLAVRLMMESEIVLIIDYFHNATPEHLETMGVDPSRIPARAAWKAHYRRLHAKPIEKREAIQLVWLDDGKPVGFSTADKIVFGERANMHLHVVAPDNRRRGVGTECVRQSADLYFATLRLKRLFCEPYALNVAPNRTLQSAGFKYVKTHMTVPGPLNYHQPVTQWMMERV